MATVIRPEVSANNEHYISRHRYYELKHFCMQYTEWKRAYTELDGSRTHSSEVIERIDSGCVAKSTEWYARRRIQIRERIELVETAAKQSAGNMAGALIKAVSEGLSYEQICAHENVPCGKELWYKTYRKFFWILDDLRE